MSTLMAELNGKALALAIPLSAHVDLTYRCNERCVYCYLPHDDRGEMSTAEVKVFSIRWPRLASSSSQSAAASRSCEPTCSSYWLTLERLPST